MRRKGLISEIIHNIDKQLCFYIFLEYSWLCTLFLPLLCWNLCSLMKKYRQESLLFTTGCQRFAGILKSCLLNSSTSAEKQHCSLLLYTLLCLLWTWHQLWRSLTGSLFSFSFFSLRYSVWVYVLCSHI